MFKNAGIEYGGIKSLTPKESKEVVEKGAFILDIREEEEVRYKALDVANVMFLPFSKLREGYKDIPQDVSIIVADSAGMKSRDVAGFLKDEGFDEIAYMAGGFREWELDKLPVTVDVDEQLSGSCFCMLKPQRKLRKQQKRKTGK